MKKIPAAKQAIRFLSVLVVAAFPGAARAASDALVLPAADIRFTATQFPGVSKADLWGKADVEAHGSMIRLAPGVSLPLHSHSKDTHVVFVKGTVSYTIESRERELGPGSFLVIPAGSRHRAKCGSEGECVYVEHQDGAFDLKLEAARRP